MPETDENVRFQRKHNTALVLGTIDSLDWPGRWSLVLRPWFLALVLCPWPCLVLVLPRRRKADS